MKNNKGFTLVEILAAVAILSIMFGLGVAAYGRYTNHARTKAIDTLLQSSIDATENFLLDHPEYTEVNFDDLVQMNYLESSADPYNQGEECSGTVHISADAVTESDQLEKYSYVVDMCCAQHNIQYNSQTERKVETSMCLANFQERDYLETGVNPMPNGQPSGAVPAGNTNCASGSIKTKQFNIYTMDYVGRVCAKGANGRYGDCYMSTNTRGNKNYPCRKYNYYQFKCKCIYSKKTNKYCGYEIVNHSSHLMRVKYYETPEGYASCNSDNPADFNSYVHDCCWDGVYPEGKDVMTFHGYKFFKGKSEGLRDFRPEGTWFHDNISGISLEDRVQRKYDIVDATGKVIPNENQGCRDTCVRFAEALSGKPK